MRLFLIAVVLIAASISIFLVEPAEAAGESIDIDTIALF
jgi:hypothetical protein